MQRARTEQDKDQRRSTLLYAALSEFFDKGFTAARMEDIAKQAGVSKGTLYLYFTNKQDLFRALIEEIAVPTISMTSKEVLACHSGEQALRFLMQGLGNIVRDTPLPKLIKVLIADSSAFPELVTFYREQVINRVLNVLETIIRKGIETKEWQCSDISLTARLIIAPAVLSIIWRMVFEVSEELENRLDLDALFALHTQYLLKVLKAN